MSRTTAKVKNLERNMLMEQILKSKAKCDVATWKSLP